MTTCVDIGTDLCSEGTKWGGNPSKEATKDNYQTLCCKNTCKKLYKDSENKKCDLSGGWIYDDTRDDEIVSGDANSTCCKAIDDNTTKLCSTVTCINPKIKDPTPNKKCINDCENECCKFATESEKYMCSNFFNDPDKKCADGNSENYSAWDTECQGETCIAKCCTSSSGCSDWAKNKSCPSDKTLSTNASCTTNCTEQTCCVNSNETIEEVPDEPKKNKEDSSSLGTILAMGFFFLLIILVIFLI